MTLCITKQVAVVADIEEIETRLVSGPHGKPEEMRIGKGKCIDMVYVGNVIFWETKPKRPDNKPMQPAR
jgi:hypothetical protein